MGFRPLSSKNSMGQNLNETNNMIRQFNKREIIEVFKDDTGTRRVLLGKGANGFYGLKVSKPGFDVYTAADDDLVFNSDNNIFKIVRKDTATVSKPANTARTVETVPHGLGYAPLVIAFNDSSPPGIASLSPSPNINVDSGGSVSFQAGFSVDATNLYFFVDTPNVGGAGGPPYSSAITQVFTYYILQETAD